MTPRLCSLMVALAFSFGLNVSTAAAQSTGPAAKKPAAEITRFEQILAIIPRGLLAELRPGSRSMTEAHFKATEAVEKFVKDKSASFKVTVGSVEKFTPNNSPNTVRYRVNTLSEKLRESGAPFNGFIMALPDISENDKAAKLQKGDKVTITGKIVEGTVTGRGYSTLQVIIVDAKLD